MIAFNNVEYRDRCHGAEIKQTNGGNQILVLHPNIQHHQAGFANKIKEYESLPLKTTPSSSFSLLATVNSGDS